MAASRPDPGYRRLAVVLVTLLVLVAGCATKVDWNTRIGSYSYDDAVKELGPPDKSAITSDGTIVSEWLMFRGHTRYAAVPAPYYRGRYYGYPGYGYPSYLAGEYYSTPDQFLRLTFGPDKLLQATKRLNK